MLILKKHIKICFYCQQLRDTTYFCEDCSADFCSKCAHRGVIEKYDESRSILESGYEKLCPNCNSVRVVRISQKKEDLDIGFLDLIKKARLLTESFDKVLKRYNRICEEIKEIGNKLEIGLHIDITEANLKVLDSFTPDMTASLQKDMKKGGNTEIDGLIFEVVRLANDIGVNTPVYNMVAKHFGYTTSS